MYKLKIIKNQNTLYTLYVFEDGNGASQEKKRKLQN